jgi:hypothetical protein
MKTNTNMPNVIRKVFECNIIICCVLLCITNLLYFFRPSVTPMSEWFGVELPGFVFRGRSIIIDDDFI